ncbi:hypothetical protein COCVIDRAFT_110492 [Bipolaris victoriae FI3]|uniref:Uncharacterized protein n=2 Tax=Bipolaris TaxID=33194 RepID=W6Y503_COCC2|nr:uncharacterized protein COCCADRAFT_97097 [Bipolaris zeicola 26-R-13]XP_014552357.1 hypothetical protein COCVIDRAFT_110492 [Bipolaris victoriae FI3]EUC33068.1 hypothetical protein COCCADRAFT_97097 [Bipolaris zeicola 26-R-13]
MSLYRDEWQGIDGIYINAVIWPYACTLSGVATLAQATLVLPDALGLVRGLRRFGAFRG